MAGLDANGFSILRLQDIQSEIDAVLVQIFGPQINTVAPSIVSQLRDTFAERESLLWELGQSIYNSQYPDSSQGVQLDNVVSLSGISRLKAIASLQQNLRLFGVAGTVIPANTQISVQGVPTSIFATVSQVTLATGQNEVQKVQFSAVPVSGTWKLQYYDQVTSILAFNANAAAVQTALNALPKLGGAMVVTGNYTSGFTITYGGSAGKQPQPLIIVAQNSLLGSGSVPVIVTPSELVAGVVQAQVNAKATVTGPVTAPAFTLNTIVTPVTGLNSANNVTDAVVGRNVESDAELKLRRTQTLGRAGAATVEAIRSKILSLTGIQTALVFENSSQVIDNFNRPPKSFEAVVVGGLDQEILDTVWAAKPAGIDPFGNTSGTITDSMGFTHTMFFSRPYTVDIYAIVNITRDVTGEVPSFPNNGVALVQAALSAFVIALGIGRDVIPNPGLMSALEPIPGIYNASILIGLAPVPTLSNPIAIAAQQVARLMTSNIVVNVT